MRWDPVHQHYQYSPVFQGYNCFDTYYTCDKSDHSLEMKMYHVEYPTTTVPLRLPAFWPGLQSPDYYGFNVTGRDVLYAPSDEEKAT